MPLSPNAVAYAVMIDYLLREPCSHEKIRLVTGLSMSGVRSYLGALRRRKLVYVAEWETDAKGRRCVKCFKLGRLPDVTKPAPMTQAQRDARRRRKGRNLRMISLTAG